MFQRILLATDGSAAAKQASVCAQDLAAHYEAQVIVVYAYQPVHRSLGTPYQDQQIEEHLREGREITDPVVEELRAAGAKVDVELLEGPAAEAILRVTETRECDLVVLGNRGLGAVTSLLLGSVSHKVLAHSTVPVLVAGAPQPES
jgi:nucleotide-binding universal stress UspA family protein